MLLLEEIRREKKNLKGEKHLLFDKNKYNNNQNAPAPGHYNVTYDEVEKNKPKTKFSKTPRFLPQKKNLCNDQFYPVYEREEVKKTDDGYQKIFYEL